MMSFSHIGLIRLIGQITADKKNLKFIVIIRGNAAVTVAFLFFTSFGEIFLLIT